MMKRICLVALAACFASTMLIAPAAAADKKEDKAPAAKKEKKKKEPKKASMPQNGEVTQGELACLLVQILGLSRFLPAAPSTHECISAVAAQGIVPPGGWQADKVVVRGDLACVLVKAMGLDDGMKNRDDVQECIDILQQQGVQIDTVGAALDSVEPLDEPVAPSVDSVTTDPLYKKLPQQFDPTDELSSGVDMAPIARTDVMTMQQVLQVVAETVVVPPKPRDVTPD